MDRRVDKLESRMNANDRRLGKLRPPQRPDPEPPYGLPDRGGADWDKQHRRYTQPTYRRPQHHQSDRYPPPPPYQPDRHRPYHLHQTRYQLPEHYQPFDYGPPSTYMGFPLHQFLQLQYEPSRQPSCWDPPGAWVSMGNLDYEEIASIYYPDYDGDSDGYDEDADKLQEEIRGLAGKKDMIDRQDIQKLPYCKREFEIVSTSKCTVNGYEIEGGSFVIINAWAVGRDPTQMSSAGEVFGPSESRVDRVWIRA
ncbi:hypothetical protein SASPL_128379 [Salvia splendens]|uniref:Uncharacterized protein n=1 Tax=Salvia splendens TaxID=180675 RepID=A0A8X8ZMP1_SALSN|nr:hypothetical protein SASPL_128379 [Salvia splendens]